MHFGHIQHVAGVADEPHDQCVATCRQVHEHQTRLDRKSLCERTVDENINLLHTRKRAKHGPHQVNDRCIRLLPVVRMRDGDNRRRAFLVLELKVAADRGPLLGLKCTGKDKGLGHKHGPFGCKIGRIPKQQLSVQPAPGKHGRRDQDVVDENLQQAILQHSHLRHPAPAVHCAGW